SLYGAFACLDMAQHKQRDTFPDELHDAALRSMYRHLGTTDATEFHAALSKSGAPLLLVRAEYDSIAGDNFWLAENTQHSVTHLLGRAQPHAYLQFAGSQPAVCASMQEIADWVSKVDP
ncbi:MAG: hypothetical protein ACPGRD_03665, partial [Planktomarina sp.]